MDGLRKLCIHSQYLFLLPVPEGGFLLCLSIPITVSDIILADVYKRQAKEHFELDVDTEDALAGYADHSFDAITLWHVMEHLEHLNETWEKLFKLLKERGVLIVAVPNPSSYDAEKYKEWWAAYDVDVYKRQVIGRQHKEYHHPQQEQHQHCTDAGGNELHIEKGP